MKTEMFGFTNDDNEYDQVVTFKKAAINDGWIPRPTYKGSNVDSIDTACSLSKDGYKMSIISRVKTNKWKYEANISIWGPDSLAIKVPEVYSMEKISKGLTVCGWCGTQNVPTQLAGFANRVCKSCLPEAREKLEYPGWCN